MTALSTAPAGAVAQAGEYLRHGDVDNVEQLLRFLADTFLLEGHGFEAPREVADLGVYVPGPGDVSIERGARAARPGAPDGRRLLLPLAPADRQHGLRRRAGARDRGRRRQRARRLELHAAPRRRRTRAGAGAARRPRRRADHDDARHRRQRRRRQLRRGGRRGRRAWQDWDATALAALDVPVIQAVCSTCSRATWLESDSGLDAARRRHAGRDPRVRRAAARRRRSRSRSATPAPRRWACRCRATSPTPSAARASPASRSTTRGCATCRPPSAGSRCC